MTKVLPSLGALFFGPFKLITSLLGLIGLIITLPLFWLPLMLLPFTTILLLFPGITKLPAFAEIFQVNNKLGITPKRNKNLLWAVSLQLRQLRCKNSEAVIIGIVNIGLVNKLNIYNLYIPGQT